MDILVKEIDVLKSTKFKGKVLSEYIIYLMVDETPIEAYTVFGSDKVVEVIQKLKGTSTINKTYFETN